MKSPATKNPSLAVQQHIRVVLTISTSFFKRQHYLPSNQCGTEGKELRLKKLSLGGDRAVLSKTLNYFDFVKSQLFK